MSKININLSDATENIKFWIENLFKNEIEEAKQRILENASNCLF